MAEGAERARPQAASQPRSSQARTQSEVSDAGLPGGDPRPRAAIAGVSLSVLICSGDNDRPDPSATN